MTARIIRLNLPPFDVEAAIRRSPAWNRAPFWAQVRREPVALPLDCTASLSGSEVVWRNADGVEVARTKAVSPSRSAAGRAS